MRCRVRRPGEGFSLIELLVTLSLLALLATLVVPLAQVQWQRQKEQELRRALVEIRQALDAYRDATQRGAIGKSATGNDYPPDLQTLVDGVEDQQHPQRRKLYFLRRLPRDPFFQDPQTEAAATWGLRSYESSAEDPQPGADVYDVYSQSSIQGLNGVPLRQW